MVSSACLLASAQQMAGVRWGVAVGYLGCALLAPRALLQAQAHARARARVRVRVKVQVRVASCVASVAPVARARTAATELQARGL